jgi:hypothetical protein
LGLAEQIESPIRSSIRGCQGTESSLHPLPDDPWTTKTDPGFKEFYDLGTNLNQLRNLAYYREVSQATLERLQDRLVRLRSCRADGCRAAENGG